MGLASGASMSNTFSLASRSNISRMSLALAIALWSLPNLQWNELAENASGSTLISAYFVISSKEPVI